MPALKPRELVDGEPLFVLRVHSSSYRGRRAPEYNGLSFLDLQLHRVDGDTIYGGEVWRYAADPKRLALANLAEEPRYDYVDDQLVAGFEAMRRTEIPILGYGLFQRGYRVIAADGKRRMVCHQPPLPSPPYDFTQVALRTIDLFEIIAILARQLTRSLLAEQHVVDSALFLNQLLDTNDCTASTANAIAPSDPIAALWHKMVTTRKITLLGDEVAIDDKTLLLLLGQRPLFDALTWATLVQHNGWAGDGRMHNFQAYEEYLHRIYAPYLETMSTQQLTEGSK